MYRPSFSTASENNVLSSEINSFVELKVNLSFIREVQSCI